MATRKVPGSQSPFEDRVQREVAFWLWYCPTFPISQIGGKLDKDPEEQPWLQGLYEDIERSGKLRNPVVIWQHHPLRGRKQPEWLLRAGSNRVWCCEQLGWETVPAVVSTLPPQTPLQPCRQIQPREVENYFKDGGKIWVNDHGFGLLAAKKPELTYADYAENTNPNLRKTGLHGGRRKIINPLIEKD